MRCAAFLLGLLLLSGCDDEVELLERPDDGCAEGNENRRFTCRVAARIATGVSEARVEVTGDEELVVHLPDDLDLQMFTGNLHADCRNAPAVCETNTQRLISSIQEAQAAANTPLSPTTVRAVIKPPEWMAYVAEQAAASEGGPDNALLHRPWIGGLSIVYVSDRPDSMAMLTRDALEELSLDDARLHALALRNLRAACADFSHETVPGTNIEQLMAGDSYEASRLLLPELWRPLADQVQGDLLVAAPSRDRVLFTGSASPVDAAELRRLARVHSADDGHSITDVVFRLTPDGFVVHEG